MCEHPIDRKWLYGSALIVLLAGCSESASTRLLAPTDSPAMRPAASGASVTSRSLAQTSTATIPAVLLPDGTMSKGANASGVIVGNAAGSSRCPVSTVLAAWTPDGTRTLLPLTSAEGHSFCGGGALAINSAGVVLGTLAGGPANQSGTWTPSGGGYVFDEIPPAPDGYQPIVGTKINDNGNFVGWHQRGAQLYWWSATAGWALMTMPAGATACEAHRAVNNAGAIVAPCAINGGLRDGYYWADFTAVPVRLPRPAGETGDVVPRDINSNGVIVGYGATRAIEWVPDGAGGYSVSYLPDFGHGAVAYAIADDGTVAGHVLYPRTTVSPALWVGGAAELLSGSGEATAVTTLNAGGVLATGAGSSRGAIYWAP